MDSKVKAGLIVAAAIGIAAWGMIHFSPYRTCVRASTEIGIMNANSEGRAPDEGQAKRIAEIVCLTGGGE